MEVHICKLATRVSDARVEMARVQLELNLQVVELQLKAQPSTLPDIREHRTTIVITTMVVVESAVTNCMKLFEQSFKVLNTLWEDPNVERLETKVHELQQKYDEVKGIAQTVALTQRLAWMQQEKALKEQVDVARHKEAVLKVHLQPWIDEAYTITTFIEGKLAKLQAAQQNIQSSSSAAVTEQRMEEV